MATQVKIVGLVRAADVVRRELTAPLTPERRDRLREQVRENLRRVEKILADSRASLRALPPPSQRAYQFLAAVDWAKVNTASTPDPNGSGDKPLPTTHTLAWRGLGSLIEWTVSRLAKDLPDGEIESISQALSKSSRQVEQSIQRLSASADRMTARTRQQRGWIAFFARPENLRAYAQARQTAGRLIDAAAVGSRHYPPPMTIHFRPMSGIYKLRSARGGPILSLPTPMIAFDEQAFGTLAELMFDRGHDARQRVIFQMAADGYQGIFAELESLGGIAETARGAVHDLSASFDRVNAAYFGGKMLRPRLTWNRTFTGRKFGHYDWIRDTVMVSRTLDTPAVPEFVVDFLMFHELLHKFHGINWINGRGHSHTPEFYADEKKFARYEEAEAVLKALAMGAG